MSTTVARLDRWSGLRAAVPPLLLGLFLLAMVFRPEATAAITVWQASTAYNHCVLVLPIAVWLAWERRDRLPGAPVRPLPWAVASTVPLAAMWLLSERLGIMEGRQFAALGCVEVLALAVLGWRMARALAAPLLYLVFLVPFGAFLTGPLQDFTAHFVVTGLDVMGITNYSDGHTIEIPEGVFYVAEACAGLRFLIAAVAFGVLYAVTMYRSPVRRLLFVAASVVAPVVANGVRALGIVAAGHWIGSPEAAAADHLIYGWLFFSAVILLLILAGLPFREDGPREAATATWPPAPALRMVMPAVLLAALAVAGPVLAAAMDRAAASTPASPPAALAGCIPAGTAPDVARSGAATRAFTCEGGATRLLVVAFPPRTNPMLILATQRSLTGQDAAEEAEATSLPSGWTAITTNHPQRRSATALWIGGAPAFGLTGRMRQARRSVLGADHPVILAVAEGSTAPLHDLLPALAALSGATP